MSHIQLPALANLLFGQDAGRHGCKHSRQSSAKYGRKGTTADVMTPKQYRVLLRSSAVGRSLRPVMGIRLFDDLGTVLISDIRANTYINSQGSQAALPFIQMKQR